MLPVLAFALAIASAVAADFLPGVQAYYKDSSNACVQGTTMQNNCQVTEDDFPICTIQVGLETRSAYGQANCAVLLKQIPQH